MSEVEKITRGQCRWRGHDWTDWGLWFPEPPIPVTPWTDEPPQLDPIRATRSRWCRDCPQYEVQNYQGQTIKSAPEISPAYRQYLQEQSQ